MQTRCRCLTISFLLFSLTAAFPDSATYQAPTKAGPFDLGPVVAFSVKLGSAKSAQVVNKAISIRLGQKADICFDTETLRYVAGWTDGTLNLSQSSIVRERGNGPAPVQGQVKFQTRNAPGWAKESSFADPRTKALGPLPAEWAKFKGLYRNGDKTILSYTVGTAEVLDMPAYETVNGRGLFTRTLNIPTSQAPLTLLVCESENARESAVISATGEKNQSASAQNHVAVLREESNTVAVAVLGAPAEAVLEVAERGRVQLRLPRLTAPTRLKIFISSEPESLQEQRPATIPDLAPFCHGGPVQWSEVITTQGALGSGGAYVLDTLGLPEKNPWNSWMRLTALDFFADGRAAVSTLSGDVWLVSGLDEKLDKVVWKRYAAGLYEPLGLKVVDGLVYALGRDQITCLHDLNGDGEADFYENFNNDRILFPGYHAFAFDLQTDSTGNFYYVVGGNLVNPEYPHHKVMLRVSRDGKKLETLASGFRAPNGMGIGNGDQILCGDNQGHWTPSSRINFVKPGGFYGYPGDPRQPNFKNIQVPATFDPPMLWLPMTADNSTGGQVWADTGKWGPLSKHWLSTSYGKCWLYYLMTEEVNGVMQAGAVRFPFTFASGVQRGRFNPRDGQLYLCGLKGWQTSAGRDGAFQRVRYTGQTETLPVGLHVTPDGLEIQFSGPLDPATATDPQSYSIAQWNYLWSANYGSDDYSASTSGKKGHDPVPVQTAKLSKDQRTVLLTISDLKPVMQMQVKFDIKAADGKRLAHEIFNTINQVPGTKTAATAPPAN